MENVNYFAQTGWVCPKCGRVFAPTTPMCSYCVPKESTTSTTIQQVIPNNQSISYGTFDQEGKLNYPPGVRKSK